MQSKKGLSKTLLLILGTCVGISAWAGEAVTSPSIQVLYPSGSQQSFQGPESYFTGDVQVDIIFPGNETAHYSGALVTFQPGARTAWHSHPAGQHMIITSGTAVTGTRDGNLIEAHQNDVVWCPPNIDHWHGATTDSAMTHMVITGNLEGENVIWKEKVSDVQYSGNQ